MVSARGVAVTAMTAMEESNVNQGRRQPGAACLLSKQSQQSIGDLGRVWFVSDSLIVSLIVSPNSHRLSCSYYLDDLIHHLDYVWHPPRILFL
jgi:hypothetical protein